MSDLIERLRGNVTEAALRLIAGAFRRDGEQLESNRRPRFSIPTRPAEDDDCVVIDALKEAATALSEAKAENERLTRERDEAVRVATNVSRALTSLTPGGSEYHSHSRILDAYFADTEACVAVVRERYASGHKAKLELVGARAALNPKGGDNGEA